MIIKPANRTLCVKEYYFSRKNREIARLNADGRTEPIINLGIGAPDRMPPMPAIKALCEDAVKEGVHAYQSYTGIPQLREAFAKWYGRFYNVHLDPTTEIQPLTGSKEGILLTSLAFLDKGDKVLVPNPGYPTYSSSAQLCEAQVLYYKLRAENAWQPDFNELEGMDLRGVKMMWTNYPNMPTGAPASMESYRKLVDFARRHRILLCNDNPYSFILNDKPISILEVEGAKECCLELNSLSKAHNMSGWRIGMVASCPEVISEILKVKSNMDSGIFHSLQIAAIKAMESGEEWFAQLNDEYRARRVEACRIFDIIGAKYNPDSTGLFLWGHIGRDAESVSDKILAEAGVFITPGFIFGSNGREYLRISLCSTPEKLRRAAEKIKALKW